MNGKNSKNNRTKSNGKKGTNSNNGWNGRNYRMTVSVSSGIERTEGPLWQCDMPIK